MRMMASMLMSVVALVAIADEYIDPQSKVVYTYEPGSGTAAVKAGYEEIIWRGEDYELDTAIHPGSPDAAGDVAILDRFTIGAEEYVVTSIGELAFSVNENITFVSIPETVTEIGAMAFNDCINLTTVQLPERLTQIAQALFMGCNKLTSVVIPSSVRRIERSAFAGCSSLASLNLPAGLAFAGLGAFNDTPWYASLYDEAPDGPFYIGSLLLGYKGDKPTGELVIRDGTTCIGNGAFHNCKDLTSVTIPQSVVIVDNNAFQNCSHLTAVHIADLAAWCGIEFMDEGLSRSSNPLFYAHHLYLDGKEVTDLVIPESVTHVGDYAFDNCTDLTCVTISDGVTSIGTGAFRKCSSLTSVTIPSSVATVGSHAFLWCFELKAVHISDLTAWGRISFHDNVASPLYYGAHLYLIPQTEFYYYKGTKILLTLIKNKVCVSIPKECDESCERIRDNVKVLHTIADEIFDTFVISLSEYEKLTSLDFWKEGSRSVILTSCYFTENKEEVYASPYLNLRLKKEEDIGLLTSYAEQYKLKIVENDRFMPLWYILSLTLDSNKSPLECANELYESGDFAASVPDLVSDDLPEPAYRPLVEEGKHWTYDNYLPVRPDEYNHDYSYDLKGDTLIAGKNCLKMYSDNRYNDGIVKYEAALYEENKKVFCFFPEKEEAVLLYDFDCEVGDTLNVYETQMIVTDIQTVMPGDVLIRIYTLQPIWDEPEDYGEVFWIEGVGATMDFFAMTPVPGNYNTLHACEVNGEKLFSADTSPQPAYRPFVEEGKVWKVGDYSGNPVRRVEYFYFDGDTIIDGKTCKQMMCQRYVSPEHPDYSVFSQFPSQSYMGAWYEEDKKVYKYDPTNKEFQLMYDFSLDANDTLWIKNASLPYIVGPRRTGGLKGFKGVYREVMQSYNENPFYNTTWLEGVGSIDGPILNVYYGEEAHAVFLMSCSVEDEVIYLNDEVVDGATPEIMDAQNRRIDFTHTIKTKPKAPAMRGLGDEEESLYGEYNELQLGINLDPLVDAYLVRITDETGNVVYEKAIDAAGIVGLNIDISTYEKGLYTVMVENDQESFTGVFEVQTTGIASPEFSPEGKDFSSLLQEGTAIYNLQGQRMSSLQKGLNIVNRRKVYVK